MLAQKNFGKFNKDFNAVRLTLNVFITYFNFVRFYDIVEFGEIVVKITNQIYMLIRQKMDIQ